MNRDPSTVIVQIRFAVETQHSSTTFRASGIEIVSHSFAPSFGVSAPCGDGVAASKSSARSTMQSGR